jgi:hypothetical protein
MQDLRRYHQGDLQCLQRNGKGNLLADGQVILGRLAAEVGDDRTIVTRDKKILHVKASDILPKPGTNDSAAQASPAK